MFKFFSTKPVFLILIGGFLIFLIVFILPILFATVIVPFYVTDNSLPKPVISELKIKPDSTGTNQNIANFKVSNCIGGIDQNQSWPSGPIYSTAKNNEELSYTFDTRQKSNFVYRVYCLKARNVNAQTYKSNSTMAGIDVLRSKEYLTINIDGDNKVSFN